MAFPPLGNSDHVVVSVSIDFPSNSQPDALFHCIAYDYSCADWDGLCDHLRDVPWENIFKLLLLLVNFVRGFRLELMYIPLIENIRSSLTHLHGFQPLVLLPVHRKHFFRLYQKDKSSASKVKFRQASNHCKRALEPDRLAYVNKTKEPIISQKLGSHDFWQTANSVLNKGKSAILPLFFLLHNYDMIICSQNSHVLTQKTKK